MKSQITSTLRAFLVLTASLSLAPAPEAQPPRNPVVVGAGNDLRCRLDKGLRITKVGEPIVARLVEPVYIGTVLAIPDGATLKGHISSISTISLSKWRLLDGDFTPPKVASVTFDQLVLSNGTSIPIHTDTTIGVGGIRTAQYLPKSQRPGIRQKMKDAAQPLRESNKLQRLSEATITSLPYHPSYLNQGTIFDATLLDPVTTPMPSQPADDVRQPSGDNYLRLRLLTPVSSQMIAAGARIEAVVSQPYYNADHTLLYPAGTKLEGSVSKASSAGWRKKNGALLFSFRSALKPDGTKNDVNATVAGVQAADVQNLAVDQEGDVKATTSLFSRLRAPLSLIGPSRAAADPSVNKTAWSRAGEGFGGFGLFGAGAAQASAATATGFGYFGAAKNFYDAFLAKGSDVDLPANTPILLRVNQYEGLEVDQVRQLKQLQDSLATQPGYSFALVVSKSLTGD